MVPTIILAVCVMLALAGVFEVLLGWANVRRNVHVPPQLEQLADATPVKEWKKLTNMIRAIRACAGA